MNTRSIVAGLAVVSFGMTAVIFAQAATDETAAKIDRARRYLSLGMYQEATNSLKDLVAADEFNADNRYLYGVALEGLGKHHEAAAQLELSLRLAPQERRAIIKLPNIYLAAYNESGANADRKKAYQAALQLLELDSPRLSSESEKDDLQQAKVLARGIIAKLESPIGVWKTPWGATFSVGIYYSPPRLAMKETLPKDATSCGHVCWAFEIKAIAGPDYAGSGNNTPMQSIGTGCMFDYDYKLRLTDAGTTLTVVETAERYRGPELTRVGEADQSRGLGAAKAVYKAADEICRKIDVPTTVGKPNEIVLERVSP